MDKINKLITNNKNIFILILFVVFSLFIWKYILPYFINYNENLENINPHESSIPIYQKTQDYMKCNSQDSDNNSQENTQEINAQEINAQDHESFMSLDNIYSLKSNDSGSFGSCGSNNTLLSLPGAGNIGGIENINIENFQQWTENE